MAFRRISGGGLVPKRALRARLMIESRIGPAASSPRILLSLARMSKRRRRSVYLRWTKLLRIRDRFRGYSSQTPLRIYLLLLLQHVRSMQSHIELRNTELEI